MSQQHPTPSIPGSSPLFTAVAVFVIGAVLGALAMIEIVPASHVVEIDGLGERQVFVPSDNLDPNAGGPIDPDGEGALNQSGAFAGPGGGDGTGTGQAPDNGRDSGNPGNGNDGNTQRPSDGGLQCAPGRNGGATDQGVTGESIQMATTVVQSGVGSSFLGDVRHAMNAVVNRVNAEGGICGRRLEVVTRDDAWDPSTGAQFLRNFINQRIFAVPIGPSSEGLNAVIQSGDFDRHQIPVVGTNGLIRTQYENTDGSAQQWVWPVAAATESSARIMARDAYDRMVAAGVDDGKPTASNFSVVFAHNYRFGSEGAQAFNAEVKRLTGDDIPGYNARQQTQCSEQYCGITAGDRSSYEQEVVAFRDGKFVAFFLEPQTAAAWMRDNNSKAASEYEFGMSGAQPLFTRGFAEACRNKCHGMLVWTGYKPFQEHYRSDPDVQRYVTDLHTVSNADENNQFTLGSYVGMELLVEGIRQVGPNLTRARLKEVLDTITFDSGLTLADPMKFSPDNRYVATRMQAWEIQHVGSFSGWRDQQIVADPRFGG